MPPPPPADDFFFLQLSDTHWGVKGAPNPQADVTLERAIATINAVDVQPDFVVFTGDLTHTTDDPAERKARLARVKEITSTSSRRGADSRAHTGVRGGLSPLRPRCSVRRLTPQRCPRRLADLREALLRLSHGRRGGGGRARLLARRITPRCPRVIADEVATCSMPPQSRLDDSDATALLLWATCASTAH
jgi:3',5'-cyclic AMP phosphodiesterase CpdA